MVIIKIIKTYNFLFWIFEKNLSIALPGWLGSDERWINPTIFLIFFLKPSLTKSQLGARICSRNIKSIFVFKHKFELLHIQQELFKCSGRKKTVKRLPKMVCSNRPPACVLLLELETVMVWRSNRCWTLTIENSVCVCVCVYACVCLF